MGKIRFLDPSRNLIADAVISSSSQAFAPIGPAVKEGTGGATLITGGTYTGDDEIEYTVEIEDVSGGTSIGQAIFRWKTSESSGWEAQGVLTSASEIALNNGVNVKFQAGTAPDFALGDLWTFKVIRYWSHLKVRDLDPDTAWHSKDAPDAAEWIKFDRGAGASGSVRCAAIGPHNLTSGGTFTLEGNATDSWASPAFSQAFTHRAGVMLIYFAAETHRWWRLKLEDAANPAGFIEVGEVHVGDYFEPSRNFLQGFREGFEPVEENGKTPAGISHPDLANVAKFASLPFRLPWADIQSLEAIAQSLRDLSALRKKPMFVNLDSEDAERTWLMHWENPFSHENLAYDSYRLEMELAEAVKSPV